MREQHKLLSFTAALALLGLSPGSQSLAAAAQSDSEQLLGWWGASLIHDGQNQPFYLHFIRKPDSGVTATLTIPAMGARDASTLPVRIDDNGLGVVVGHWHLLFGNDRQSLEGAMPHTLVPYYELEARFTKMAMPPPVAIDPVPSGAAPRPLWTKSLGASVYGGVGFDAERRRILIGDLSGKLTALEPGSGQTIWSIDLGAAIRATPTIHANSVYVPTDKNLVRLNAASGREIWRRSLGAPKTPILDPEDPKSRSDIYSSAAVVDRGIVYVGSRDGCIHAFRASDGGDERQFCATDIITATPVVRDGAVYFGSFDGHVYAARRGRGFIWNHDMHGAVTTDLGLAAGHLIAGSRSYDLSGLTLSSGAPVWTRYFWFSWVESSPAVAGSQMYIGSSDACSVFAFDSRSGARLWQSRIPGWSWPRPALSVHTVYAGVIGTTEAYFGERKGGLAALDRRTGQLKWFLPSSPALGRGSWYGFAAAPLVARGMVFAADLHGDVYALAARAR